ncbi:MBOAT family protein [Magnetospirillum sp. UT-4]|uniref:MBOAT family O-acyltransferase n=1 Tax=Magnetospirillum sp. UT-4 TaxID=2681467 RepID=UPI00137CE197|nr:MBOAT family protein [Magnetospirillum sp. UT-4]CAA7612117.1 putative membrane protein involved in D-alanine export [Magnetospirillum sp. UT-4]
MLFNSVEFFVFLVVVLAGHRVIAGPWRGWWLLAASLLFYAYWNVACLPLLAGMVAISHFGALAMAQQSDERRRRRLLVAVILANLAILALFKYVDFAFAVLADAVGWVMPDWIRQARAALIGQFSLPLGISFFTFQVIAYTVDVYRREFPPQHRLDKTLLFISYFPHLVAGPIMRARELLPQLPGRVCLDRPTLASAFSLMTLGLFKKVVVADSLATLSDPYFANPTGVLADAWAATIAFSFQIYADFSGYTDLAMGISLLFGIKLVQNFDQPYLKTNITDFWRAWHMSLSRWFRDYFYIPLGGSQEGRWRFYLNLVLTMTVVGLWHGANYTFLVWGAYHGMLLVGHKVIRDRSWRLPLPAPVKAVTVFILVALGWVFFRSPDMATATQILGQAWSGERGAATLALAPLVMVPLVIVADYLSLSDKLPRHFQQIRKFVPLVLLVLIFLLGSGKSNQFIYFEF